MSSTDPKTENSESTSLNDDWIDRFEQFMIGGGCKESVTTFGNCIEEAEKKNETAGKCFPMLLSCMEEHSDYYKPLFEANKNAEELVVKELEAIFTGDSYEGFMEGGGCKESFRVWEDCMKEAEKKNENIAYCAEGYSIFERCMEARSDYYQPYFALKKSANEVVKKELDALLAKND